MGSQLPNMRVGMWWSVSMEVGQPWGTGLHCSMMAEHTEQGATLTRFSVSYQALVFTLPFLISFHQRFSSHCAKILHEYS